MTREEGEFSKFSKFSGGRAVEGVGGRGVGGPRTAPRGAPGERGGVICEFGTERGQGGGEGRPGQGQGQGQGLSY